jgi:hypothetical protein
VLLARNTTCTLFKFVNDLAIISVVIGIGVRSIGDITIVVDVVVDIVVVDFTMAVENASTEDDVQSERRIIARSKDDDDTAMMDFMIAVCCVAG